MNRWSRASRDAVLDVFDKLGGVDAMTEWARKHPGDFYRGLYGRLLPTRSELEVSSDTPRRPEEMSDEELLAMIEEGRVAGKYPG